MMDIKIGTHVAAIGHSGRFEVVEIKGARAKIKLLANKKDSGEPVELNYIEEVPISILSAYKEN